MTDSYRQADHEKACARCNVPLAEVTVVDHTHGSVLVGIAYTTEKTPTASLWSGKLANASGILAAFVCPRCQLVAWYAKPAG